MPPSILQKKCYQSYKVDGSTAFFFQLSVSVVALMYKSPKCFLSGKQPHDETKTNQTRWEWHHNTFPPSLHLMPFLLPLTQICFMFVSCVKRRVVEGSGLGSGECVVHVDVHVEWVMLWVAAMVLPVRRNCGVHEQCWICMVCWCLSYVVKFYFMADVGCLLCGKLWSEHWVSCSFNAYE